MASQTESVLYSPATAARAVPGASRAMSSPATTTRSRVGAESGRDAEQLEFLLDKETGIITSRDGSNEQMWVLIMAPQSKEEKPVCGALLRSNADGGEIPCLSKVSDKIAPLRSPK